MLQDVEDNPLAPSKAGEVMEEEDLGPDLHDLGPFSPPPLGSESDPFYAFRDELAQSTRAALAQLGKFKLARADAARAATLEGARGALQEMLQFQAANRTNLRENIGHLEKVILHVERNHEELFSEIISEQDLLARREFLRAIQTHYAYLEQECARLVSALRQDISAASEREAMERARMMQEARQQQQQRLQQQNNNNNARQLNGSFSKFNQEQQMLAQDQSLEEISSTLGRLKQVGDEVYHEIEAQNTLLDDLQDDTLNAETRLGTAMNRLDKVLNTSSRGHTCAIVFLACFLLGEILLVSVL